jgi:glycosyltransferase involved in cell wall biosynthesis
MKIAIVAVTNDLTTDQRVHRTCKALAGSGYQVTLVGRRMRDSLTLIPREYETERIRLVFDKGPLFYAEYNIRLFFFLLRKRASLLVTNDTDTLPAGFFASMIRRIPLLHDCHEYFRGVPELVGRKRVTAAWKFIEDLIFPRLKYVMAVNASVAGLYMNEYHVPIRVVRNVPFRREKAAGDKRTELGIPLTAKVILYQGALNVDRGLEEAILAMKHVRVDAVLVIAGTGDIAGKLHNLATAEKLGGRVRFTGQIPLQELHHLTGIADLGLSVEKEVGINYMNCLPNKFLDYIQAGVPVLVTPFPEMKKIVDEYGIGEFIGSHDPQHLADQFDRMLGNEAAMATYRANLVKAADALCWENEVHVLTDLIRQIP